MKKQAISYPHLAAAGTLAVGTGVGIGATAGMFNDNISGGVAMGAGGGLGGVAGMLAPTLLAEQISKGSPGLFRRGLSMGTRTLGTIPMAIIGSLIGSGLGYTGHKLFKDKLPSIDGISKIPTPLLVGAGTLAGTGAGLLTPYMLSAALRGRNAGALSRLAGNTASTVAAPFTGARGALAGALGGYALGQLPE